MVPQPGRGCPGRWPRAPPLVPPVAAGADAGAPPDTDRGVTWRSPGLRESAYGKRVRFQISRVMDTIEQRLTTDVEWAQAVVDLGEVIRHEALDGGRPVNLVRIGMVIDALSRYLVDGGAMVYGVVARELLSESALTSKERMVLSRWADDGLIEVTAEVGDRVPEVAHLSGLPVLTFRPFDSEMTGRYPWLAEGSGRVLRLTVRHGAVHLSPLDETTVEEEAAPARAVGRAAVPRPDGEGSDAASTAGGEAAASTGGGRSAQSTADGQPTGATVDGSAPATSRASAGPALPWPAEVLLGRSAARVSRTLVTRDRFTRAEPAGTVARRRWRCPGMDCPAFGEHRRGGQPVPRLRDGVAVCPRHGEPVVDVGPRPAAFPLSLVVNDLPRRRLMVRAGAPLRVGRGNDDPEVVAVAEWLHKAAASWVSPVHVRFEAEDNLLTVFDESANGTTVWHRKGPDDPGTARVLHRDSAVLGDWDSVELYTGIELMRGDRRLSVVVGRDEPASVLRDAPTAAYRHV